MGKYTLYTTTLQVQNRLRRHVHALSVQMLLEARYSDILYKAQTHDSCVVFNDYLTSGHKYILA